MCFGEKKEERWSSPSFLLAHNTMGLCVSCAKAQIGRQAKSAVKGKAKGEFQKLVGSEKYANKKIAKEWHKQGFLLDEPCPPKKEKGKGKGKSKEGGGKTSPAQTSMFAGKKKKRRANTKKILDRNRAKADEVRLRYGIEMAQIASDEPLTQYNKYKAITAYETKTKESESGKRKKKR